MEDNEIQTKKNKTAECAAQMALTQALCVTVILLAVLAVKYFFTGYYPALSEWYTRHICAETDVNEVLVPSEASDAV